MLANVPPPEPIDLYRYQNGEIVIRQVRSKEDEGQGPPWRSFKVNTRIEARARARLTAWLKQRKIEGVDPATVPIRSTPVAPKSAKASPGTALVPVNGKETMTEAERQAYKNGYSAAAYHRRKGGAKGGSSDTTLRDIVGLLAANLNALAVTVRLLQDRLGDTTSE
jgi:hypothetical protein